MGFLDKLESYLPEQKEVFEIYPVDYDLESGVSFGIKNSGGDDIATIKIKTIEGVPIDGLDGNYEYDNVYCDMNVVGNIDDVAKVELLTWLVKKLMNIGYNKETIRIDGKNVFTQTIDDVDANEPIETTGDDIDFSDYWGGDTNDDEEDNNHK